MKLEELLKRIENDLKLRNYSRKTIKSYLICLADYFRYIKNVVKDPDIGLIKRYLLEKQDRGQASQTINLYLNAIKYFYREIFKNNVPLDIKFAKTASKLPVVLSKKEIEKIIDSISNKKQPVYTGCFLLYCRIKHEVFLRVRRRRCATVKSFFSLL